MERQGLESLHIAAAAIYSGRFDRLPVGLPWLQFPPDHFQFVDPASRGEKVIDPFLT
jgi:hypothetical protein